MDLLVRCIPRRLWILQVASNNLIASRHHDVRTLRGSNSIPTVALRNLRYLLVVRLEHCVQLLALEADRFD